MKYIDNRINANIVKLEDENNNYMSEDVEGALEEIDSKIKNIEANGYDDTQIKQHINNIKTEIGTEELTTTDKTIKGAVNEIDSQIKDIKNKFNADEINLEDANNNYTSENVEGALEEIDSQIKEKALQLENNENKINILSTDKVNVLSFGAKGDGITDDTEAIQNAINFVHNVKDLRHVFLPTGNYLISKPLIIPVGVSLIGVEGLKGEYNSTIIKNTNSNKISNKYSTVDKTGNISFEIDSILIFIDDFPEGYEIGKFNNGAGKCIVKNLYLKSNNNSDFGVFAANLNNIEFDNIKVSNVKTAFKTYLLWMASFKNIMCHHIERGFDFDYGVDGWNTTINMYKCYVHTCKGIAYKFKKIASVHMDTCVYEESFGGFIYAEDRTRITMNNVHTEQCGYKGNTDGSAFKDSSFISLSDSTLTINGGFLQFDNEPNITKNPYNSCFSLVNRSNVIMNNTAIYMNNLSENSLFIYCADRSRFYLNSFTPMHGNESIIGGGQYCDDTSQIYINNNRPSETWLLKRLGYPCLDTDDSKSNFKIYVDSNNGNDFNPGTLNRPKKTIKQALKMLERATCEDVQEIFLIGDFSSENIIINSSNCRILIRGYNDSYINVGRLEVNNSHNLHFKYLNFTSSNSVISLNYSHTRLEFIKSNGTGDGLTSSQIGINIQGGQCTVENYIEFNNVYRRIQATRGGYISTLCDAVSNGNAASRMAVYSGLIMTNVAPDIKEENNGGKIYP